MVALTALPNRSLEALRSDETEILLMRHGETDWNKEQRVQGCTDIPLNEAGIVQADILASHLFVRYPNVADTIYSSDLQRSFQTAHLTAQKFRNKKIVALFELREFNWGSVEGMSYCEKDEKYNAYDIDMHQRYPKRKERWTYPIVPDANAETLSNFATRIRDKVIDIAKLHLGKKVLVFGHDKAISILIIDTEELETDRIIGIPNCAVAHFLYSSHNKILQFLNIENIL